MRVGLLTFDYPPSPSGLSTAAREIAESLAEAGADVRVLTLDREGRTMAGGVDMVGCAIAPDSRIARFRHRAALGHLAAPFAFRRAALALHAERPFDVVEATNWYAPGALLAGRAPFAFVTRNSTPAAFTTGDAEPSLRNRLDGRFAEWLERRSAARSNALISNTEAHGRTIETVYRLAGHGRPHAAIGLSLPPEMLARGARAGASLPADVAPFVFLFVGRAEERKGFDLILDACRRLSRDPDTPAIEIRLVGVASADLPADLDAGARSMLRPLGRVPADALVDAYEGAHAVLAPSRYESFGLVYQEALAFGRPVVACTEDASARQFIGEPEAGLLIDRTTGADLADEMRAIATDRRRYEALAGNARHAAGRFDRARLASETLALYERAIDAVSRRRA